MKIITTEYIESLKPCQDRLDNWKKYHINFNNNLSTFLDLENITHSDKLWVYFRSIPVKTIPLVAADFAERVLYKYESLYPNDDRVRKAIEVSRIDNVSESAKSAAWSAAWSAESAAWSAAESAAKSAAWSAAWSAKSAAESAAESAAWSAKSAAESAAESAKSADNSTLEELEQIKIMKKYLEENTK